MAAYDSAVGLLAPYAQSLEQADRPYHLRKKTHYASGVGIDCAAAPSRIAARAGQHTLLDARGRCRVCAKSQNQLVVGRDADSCCMKKRDEHGGERIQSFFSML